MILKSPLSHSRERTFYFFEYEIYYFSFWYWFFTGCSMLVVRATCPPKLLGGRV